MVKNEIALNNSNLYLKGAGNDSNGNSIVKLTFPNQRGFSLQTNGNLPATHGIFMWGKKLKDLTETELEIIELESIAYIKKFGSKKQQDSLLINNSSSEKVQSFVDKQIFKSGGSVESHMGASDLEEFAKGGKIPSALAKRIETANKFINFAIENDFWGETDWDSTVETNLKFTKPIIVKNQFVHVEYQDVWKSGIEKDRYNVNDSSAVEDLRWVLTKLINSIKKGAKVEGLDIPKFEDGGEIEFKKGGSVKKLSETELKEIASDFAYATSGDLDRATWRLLDYEEALLPKYIEAIKVWEEENDTSIRSGGKRYSERYADTFKNGGKIEVDEFLQRTLYGDKMHYVFDDIGMDMPEDLEGDTYHETMEEAYNKAFNLYSKHPDRMTFKGGGEMKFEKRKNTEVILTENRTNGATWKGIVTPNVLKDIKEFQHQGGFKRYEIDIYNEELSEKPNKSDINSLNGFMNNVGVVFGTIFVYREDYEIGGEIKLSAKERARLSVLQAKEDLDNLTSSEHEEYDSLVVKYRKTKDYKGGKRVLRRVHPKVSVQPFITYYEQMGYSISTVVAPDGYTEIIGIKN